MTSQAAVDVLIEKGAFEPRVALAVAEAIDTAMTQSQIVTVPILDASLAELKADTRISLANLERKIEVTHERIKVEWERTRAELVAGCFSSCSEMLPSAPAPRPSSTSCSIPIEARSSPA
jgi:hypothetical protein